MEAEKHLPEPKRNHDLINGSMLLPTIDTFTEQKIDTAINEVYKGYTRANPDAMKSLEQVVQYVRSREDTHSKTLAAGLTTAIKIRATVNACRWDLGYVISKAMQNTEFGGEVVPALAKELGFDESDVVGITQVHANLTRVQAYVMGLYGVSITRLIQVASIPDKNTREKIVELCCSSPIDLTKSSEVSRFTKKVQNAIEAAMLPKTPTITTSEDDEDDEKEQEEAFDVIPDSVHDAVRALESVESLLKPFRESRLKTDVERLSAVDPSTLDTGKEAIQHMLDIIREKSAVLAKDLNNVEDMLREYREAVDSLIAVFGGGTDDVEENSRPAEEE